MNINSDNNIFEDNSVTTQSFDSKKDNNSEEDLVNDLKDSLHKSVDESLNMLNFLMQEIQDKVEDESVKEETKKLVNLLSENILNLYNTNTNKIGFIENFEQSNLEEE